MSAENKDIENIKKVFVYYKTLGEKTFSQLSDEQLFWQYNAESNSIAILVKHLWGNMLSRWTDFLTTDGEKNSRDRDAEFQNDISNKEELFTKWNEAWACLFTALETITSQNLHHEVFIRNQGHTVIDAVNRQLAHYAYHIGQIVFVGKMVCDSQWQSLSIPKGNSAAFNQEKFSEAQHTQHFTEEFIKGKK